jgi:hypothetical protein
VCVFELYHQLLLGRWDEVRVRATVASLIHFEAKVCSFFNIEVVLAKSDTHNPVSQYSR